MSEITLEKAREAVSASVAKARALGVKMCIAVVDTGANLKAFARMDEAFLGSVDVAIKKARTVKLFDFNTEEIGKLSQPGGPLYGIENSNGGLITFAGGIPIHNKAGEVIGAIGASGSTPEHDQMVAEAGAQAAGS